MTTRYFTKAVAEALVKHADILLAEERLDPLRIDRSDPGVDLIHVRLANGVLYRIAITHEGTLTNPHERLPADS